LRELKFRFYDHKISKDMIYQHSYEARNVIFDKWETTPKCSPLMQYTGLKDTNNREIYEGDIYECKQGIKGEIYWAENWGMWAVCGEALMRNIDGKIIGNKYENPELV
jgi:hypothetical protein